MELLNKSQLAERLGHDPTYVSAMVRCGYQMQFGNKTTLRHALAWKKENPGFRVSDAYPSMLPPRLRGMNQGRKFSAVGKSREPLATHDR